MSCHFCQADAVTRCQSCGELICAEHGGKNDCCPHCSTGIVAGDPRVTGISEEPLPPSRPHGWWRPQQADEYAPPTCYVCQGLARLVCRNCQSKYCPEHAGGNGLCKECNRSANLGIYIFASMALLLIIFFLCNYLFG